MKLLLKVSFIGSGYCGFQCQKNGMAVQNVLTDAAEKVFGLSCNVTGCSRTDSGVHALGFCCTVEPRDAEKLKEKWYTIPVGKVHCAFAPHLPHDISVVGACEVEDDFHPRYASTGKEYVYKIWAGKPDDPFSEGRSCRFRLGIKDDEFEKMRRAAEFFVGEHDFSAFMASGSKITDAVRTVYYANVEKAPDGMVFFTVAANGFLYNMVRIMAGTLLDVAKGRIAVSDVENIILSKKRENAGFTAPPEGLYLNRVFYEEDFDFRCE